jgi:hypothetical protein
MRGASHDERESGHWTLAPTKDAAGEKRPEPAWLPNVVRRLFYR